MTVLNWSSGKFVYPRGSTFPIHFMPLQDFSLEPALNYSLLVALRVARTEGHDALLSEINIAQWRARLLTVRIVEMAKHCAFVEPSFHEMGSDVALTFEEMKYAHAEIGGFKFALHSDDRSREEKLEVLHGLEYWQLERRYEGLPYSGLTSNSVLLVNSHLGCRPQHEMPASLEQLTVGAGQGAILALRATDTDATTLRTTVHGRRVQIPALPSCFAWMSRTDLKWFWQFLPKHDREFFLPEQGLGDVGVLLAYGAAAPQPMPGFAAL